MKGNKNKVAAGWSQRGKSTPGGGLVSTDVVEIVASQSAHFKMVEACRISKRWAFPMRDTSQTAWRPLIENIGGVNFAESGTRSVLQPHKVLCIGM